MSSLQPAGANSTAPPSERVRVRRKRERGSYDRAAIDAILDEGLIAHVGIVDEDGQPFVIPTLHARKGDVVYCHGSSASRTLRTLASGAPTCLTVSLIDGLVLARAAMHHSANYRSAMVIGQATLVADPQEKLAALEAVVEHIVPGRWADVRAPTENELKATSVLALAIDEASAKARSGGPMDDEEDYALEAWAGVIPLRTSAGAPEADTRLRAGIVPPPYATAYRRPATR
ncbi:MAG TPA: pyridoxamine 5'-phosphate oxidase family protein [Solirubrobacteraceae bacterium]|nr:pyridoxamine 5'-phosphate oxidase family protein [Solirubrobacteraceae bacterium]